MLVQKNEGLAGLITQSKTPDCTPIFGKIYSARLSFRLFSQRGLYTLGFHEYKKPKL